MKKENFANKFDYEDKILFPLLDINPDFVSGQTGKNRSNTYESLRTVRNLFGYMCECCTRQEN